MLALRIIGMHRRRNDGRFPISSANTDGTINNVANVETTKPADYGSSQRRLHFAAMLQASAIGTMPTVMAQAVIKIGRSRS